MPASDAGVIDEGYIRLDAGRKKADEINFL